MVFAVLPAEHRSTAFHYYLSTVLWPLQTISDHLLGNTGCAPDSCGLPPPGDHRISVTEEAGCPLQVVATLEETDVVATKEALRRCTYVYACFKTLGFARGLTVSCDWMQSDEEGDYKLVISN
eukprot:gene9203-10907_t